MAYRNESRKKKGTIYGEVIVLGFNGAIQGSDIPKRRSKYVLRRRQQPNGVRPSKSHVVKAGQVSKSISDSSQHCISYTMSRTKSVVVEYTTDDSTDMFQVGRSSEWPIDIVVLDTNPAESQDDRCPTSMDATSTAGGAAGSGPSPNTQSTDACATASGSTSTVSRFACRIIVDRAPPYTARVYAAGFDSSRNIFLGEKATKWQQKDGEIDGLTTNGVLIMQPSEGVSLGSAPGVFREVSVCGKVYAIRDFRSTPSEKNFLTTEDNVLVDGTIIDLCGATLLWRTAIDLNLKSPSREMLNEYIAELNAGRPQCPVGLTTLIIPGKASRDMAESPIDKSRQPYIYLNCGHVHGAHGWGRLPPSSGGANRSKNNNGAFQNGAAGGGGAFDQELRDIRGNKLDRRRCPMCNQEGGFVKLEVGLEPSLYGDASPLTHCFNPCGHTASEFTVRYWSNIRVPHGNEGFRPKCPFCSTPVATMERAGKGNPIITRLIFQDHTNF